MNTAEYEAATTDQPDEYRNELVWAMEKASCKTAVMMLSKKFWEHPSAFNWVELEQAMARYQNISLNCRWKEE